MPDSENSSEGNSSDNGSASSEKDDNSEPEGTDSERCYKLKVKCIGSKKEPGYQFALRTARDIMFDGHVVPVAIF